MFMRRSFTVALTAALGLGVTACGSENGRTDDGRVQTLASFYPMQYALERIGGPDVTVKNLTKAGQEPHDVELTPRQVASVADAGLIVYAKGFQASVDDAVASSAKAGRALDVSPQADLDLTAEEEGHYDESEHEHAAHAGGSDPHFWLDPVRYKAVVQAIGDRLAKDDPEHADGYHTRTASLVKDLDALDAEYRGGLAHCTNRTIVTGHEAFAYLAARYGLTQRGASGVSPEAEPTPVQLSSISDYVKKNKVTTIYAETLVSPKVAQTIASQTGARVDVLDPIEGLTDASKGSDYLAVMRSNLATLKKGQGCS